MRIKALLLIVLLVLLSGCGALGPAPVNEIRPMELSEREQSIVDLLGSPDREILLFEYDVSEPCTQFEAWVEVYEWGELVENRAAGFGMSDPGAVTPDGKLVRPWKGTVAVTIDQTPDFVWTFSVHSDGGGASSHNSEPLPAPGEGMASAKGKITEPVPVVAGEEIILYSAVYSSGDTMLAYNEEQYKDPEQIKKQEYLQLIKCRFSMEE